MHHVLQRVRCCPTTHLTALKSATPIVWRTMATSSSAGHQPAGRTYNDAIDALNSLQTPYAIIEARRKAGVRPDATSIAEMHEYLRRIGYAATDLDRLNVVHVAGTKGKGSTCAFAASILAHYQKKTAAEGQNESGSESRPPAAPTVPRRVGLFTSPHLIAVRERIRVDGAPVSEDTFARYFFEVWDRLGEAEAKAGAGAGAGAETATAREGVAVVPMAPRPIYSRYLTLMSYHVFLSEGVDAAVYETGIGGEYDATNVVPRPVATGISTLGIDHVFALGDTVEKIAWHKAGIMKRGSAAFTIEQVPGAARVLRERADEKGVDLQVLGVDPRLKGVNIRPDALFQKKNASLGVALAETALRRLDPGFVRDPVALPRAFVDGLEQVVWRGRCEVKTEGRVVWHIDGAHTIDSLKMATRWFAGECAAAAAAANNPNDNHNQSASDPKVLIFNQQGRDEAVDFLDVMFGVLQQHQQSPFAHVVFCSNVTYAATGYKRDFVNRQHDPAAVRALTAQRAFADRWRRLDPRAAVDVLPTIEDAIKRVRAVGRELGVEENKDGEGGGEGDGRKVRALITGSLHLVGGALGILEGADAL